MWNIKKRAGNVAQWYSTYVACTRSWVWPLVLPEKKKEKKTTPRAGHYPVVLATDEEAGRLFEPRTSRPARGTEEDLTLKRRKKY